MQFNLVTGAAGFIGSHLVRAMLGEPRLECGGIVILDDLSGGFRDNVPDDSRVTFIEGSITDQELVNDLFEKFRFRFVYHLAAYAAEGLSHFIRRFNYTNNLLGSMNLINAAVNYGCGCFVFTSSIAVYGPAQVPMREEMVPQPEDPYGIAKYAVELDLKAAHAMFGLNYVIFRPHNVYGEFQNIEDRYRNVVGIFMNQILRNEPMTVFGDGNQGRAFSYVGDIAPILARSPLEKKAYGRVFNIGADIPYSVNTLAEKVAEAMGVWPVIRYLPPRQEVRVAYSDHRACREIFGKESATGLEDGLRKMAYWVKQVGSRASKEFRDIEVQRGMPPSWLHAVELNPQKKMPQQAGRVPQRLPSAQRVRGIPKHWR
jgi:UDP-glucose 4-epimerase